MFCSQCGSETRIVQDYAHYVQGTEQVRRTRQCVYCGVRYRTIETVVSKIAPHESRPQETTPELCTNPGA